MVTSRRSQGDLLGETKRLRTIIGLVRLGRSTSTRWGPTGAGRHENHVKRGSPVVVKVYSLHRCRPSASKVDIEVDIGHDGISKSSRSYVCAPVLLAASSGGITLAASLPSKVEYEAV